MLSWKTLNSLPLAKYCKGLIVAARIYADVKGGKCPCGGEFSARIPLNDNPKIIVPRCASCSKLPSLFLIDADGKDANGNKIRLKIRNDQNNSRLEEVHQVVFTLNTIQKEIMEGTFDVNRYASKEARETFRFKNYIVEYLDKYTGNSDKKKLPTKDITPKGLRDKKSLINLYLLPFFGNKDLSKINRQLIERFKESIKGKDRTRDLATGELRTILREAHKDGMILLVPTFEVIPKAKMRKEIISLTLARDTIQKIPSEIIRDMTTLLTIYPMRPCELRALRWKDIDFVNDKIWIKGHFSDEQWIKGRKSVKEGEKSELDFPIKDESRAILNKYRPQNIIPIGWQEGYVFKGRFGQQVTDSALNVSWATARKEIGHAHQLYEIRHRCLTDFANRSNGDIVKMMRVSGHTNPHTLMSRYIRDNSDLSDLF